MSVPICNNCKKNKSNMRAYVPVKQLNGVRYTTGKPCFICADCLQKLSKIK